jgi:hypothetical protein
LELCLVIDSGAADHVIPAVQKAGWTAKVAGNLGDNISIARNAGLSMAMGDIVAFIDDDAVPEPTWASRIAAAFADASVVAATGYTIGRNGISLQWAAAEVDATGQDHALPLSTMTTLHKGSAFRAIKPVGTNCAFRRSALMNVGGFDPAFRFYLEDADIGLRLASAGLTAVVPGARVHHAYAASARRRADRVPTNLHQIGASSQVFLRRHAPHLDWQAPLAALRRDQKARLDRLVAARRITAAEAGRLTATLDAGIADGADRALADLAPMTVLLHANAPAVFNPLPGTGARPGRIIAGRIWQKTRLLREARDAVAKGGIVTVICLAPTPRAHQMRFTQEGYWLQTGGLFGRSDRAAPRLQLTTFSNRIVAETVRIAPFRPVSGG